MAEQPNLIRHGRVEHDTWQVLRPEAGEAAETVAVPNGPVLVPLTVWQAQRDALASRDDVGVWLAGTDEPAALAPDFDKLALIAVDFPKFVDGRGYSVAALLRRRLGWTGELRAIGQVLHDQLFYMTRVGFDSLALAAGVSAEYALNALRQFDGVYQFSVDTALSAERRRFGVAA